MQTTTARWWMVIGLAWHGCGALAAAPPAQPLLGDIIAPVVAQEPAALPAASGEALASGSAGAADAVADDRQSSDFAGPDASSARSPTAANERLHLGSRGIEPGATPGGAAAPLPSNRVGTRGNLDFSRGGWLQVVGAMGIVLLVAWAASRVMRRFAGRLGGTRRPSGVLDILARFPMARGQHLLLLRLGRRVLLVHQAAGAMTTLSELIDEDEVAALLARIEAGSREGMAGRFQSVLDRFNTEHGGPGPAAEVGGRSSFVAGETSPRAELIDLTRRRPSHGGRPNGSGGAGFGQWLRRLRGHGSASR